MERIYLNGEAAAACEVALPPERAHYLWRVLRLRAGSEIAIFDGLGREWLATLVGEERRLFARIERLIGADPEPVLRLRLAQGLPKQGKPEFVFQKACELGVSGLIPLLTERTIVKLPGSSAHKLERWESVIEEACRQCGRRRLPELLAPCTLHELVARKRPEGAAMWLAYEGEDLPPLRTLLDRTDGLTELTLIVGPEGGFASAEIAAARAEGVELFGLGPRVLRSETAGLVALSLVQDALGDLRLPRVFTKPDEV